MSWSVKGWRGKEGEGEGLDKADAHLPPDRGGGVVGQGEQALQVTDCKCPHSRVQLRQQHNRHLPHQQVQHTDCQRPRPPRPPPAPWPHPQSRVPPLHPATLTCPVDAEEPPAPLEPTSSAHGSPVPPLPSPPALWPHPHPYPPLPPPAPLTCPIDSEAPPASLAPAGSAHESPEPAPPPPAPASASARCPQAPSCRWLACHQGLADLAVGFPAGQADPPRSEGTGFSSGSAASL